MSDERIKKIFIITAIVIILIPLLVLAIMKIAESGQNKKDEVKFSELKEYDRTFIYDPDIEFHTSGDFIYYVKKNKAIIIELTNEAKKKEVIYVPTSLDGIEISVIDTQYLRNNDVPSRRGLIKSIYYPETIDYCNIYYYVKEFRYKEVDGKKVYKYHFGGGVLEEPQIRYYKNYGENDLYIVDKMEQNYINTNEALLTIPPTPIRKGWKFQGWYLDKECTKFFDFNITTYTSEKIDLYAKWGK